MNKKIFLGMLVFFISIFIILLNNYSYAAYYSNGPIEMESSETEIEVGDTFKVTVLIPNLASSRSITEAEVTLSYDSNIIECIETNRKDYHYSTSLIEEEGKIKYTLNKYSVYAVGNGSVLFEATFKVNAPGNIKLKMVYNSTEGTTSQKFKNEERSISLKSNLALNNISLNKEQINLIEGETEQINVIYNPVNTTDNKEITWTSSNKMIACVNENGLITAVSEGTTTITASCNGKTAECEVIVSKRKIPLESIMIGEDILLKLGEECKLNITYNPVDTTDSKNVIWSSSQDKVVSVDNNGVLQANSEGIATVTASCNGKNASIKVTVYADELDKNEDNKDENINVSDEGQENISNEEKIEHDKNTNVQFDKEENILDDVPKTGGKNYIVLFTALLIISIILLILSRKNMYK